MKSKKRTMTKMEKVAKDLVAIKFAKGDTMADCMEKFFDILRKYNIRKSTPLFDDAGEVVAMQGNNFDYTMCEALFYDRMRSFFEMELNFGKLPKDIE